MIGRIIEFSIRNRAIVLIAVAAVSVGGVAALFHTPVDAIPDLSENQVIVWADWPGRSPREIEDQITYPLSVNLQGLAGVKDIRATSEFGFSMINIIFEDDVDFYFARERVLERLSIAGSFLPPGVVPYLAPDATALGQIFWYTVEGDGHSLDELRAVQDWYVRYQLNAVPGVAQVSSAGGFVREYQIDVDPEKLRAYELSLGDVFGAVAGANSSVGGKVVVQGGAEYLVRGYGWIRGIEDVRSIVVAERDGVPITVERLGTVQLGPAFRRSMLEKNGGEAVGGVVMMRYGENPLEVTRRIKERIAEMQPGLPAGVRIVPFYDRTALIEASIGTLRDTLIEEIVIASLVVFLVLYHARSAFVICCTLPIAVLVSFIFMWALDIPSNIMSLSGIAISIGVLIDAGIVMTENAYHRLHDGAPNGIVAGDTRPAVIEACKLVGGPLFFSILIMLLSFAPVFALTGMEGRMFHPLAFTKSFALVGVAVLAITLVPALIPTFVRGRLRSQEEVWLVRSFLNIYRPVLDFVMRHPDVIVVITGLFMVAGLPVFPREMPWLFFVLGVPFLIALSAVLAAKRPVLCLVYLGVAALVAFRFITPLGGEFMPPLDELAIMDMPVTTPNASTTQAAADIKRRDVVLRTFPEVHQVVGKVGRAETPTDPAPVDMVETIVSMRPREWWPKRKINYDVALAEAETIAAALGVSPDGVNTATMEAMARFDAATRDFSMQRLREFTPVKGRELVRLLVTRLTGAPPDPALEAELTATYARRFDEWILAEDVKAIAQRVAPPERLVDPPSPMKWLGERAEAITGVPRKDLLARLRDELDEKHDELMGERVRRLNWEIQDRAAGTLVWFLIEALAKREGEDLHALRAEREREFDPFLWQKLKSDIEQEMDSELQVPGWGNIWTQPIVNRVDMLATGVRTMIGVKVYGDDLDKIQSVSQEVAAVLKKVRGARDVIPDQIVGENYLEIGIDREKAARYGVSVEDVQDTIEVALGGKEITLTVEGRERFPVRVRYPRDWREDVDRARSLLVGRPPRQIPLSQVADVRVVQGPSMIKSENGNLRAYVQLNVRGRDIVSFVEEARRRVDAEVKRPPGFRLEWGGQFEHQERAQKKLTVVVPAVLLIIFMILFLTYRDFSDTMMMFLAVPGAVAGGAIFQALWGYNFSVAVMVGYIACLGLATETGIVMMVYLREAIDRRGGMDAIASEEQIREAVMEGAIQRLRPKLLTEGTTILALIPMLWATGVGAEFMKPMAVPIIGGILVADEVIDILIPVLFYKDRCRRLRARLKGGSA